VLLSAAPIATMAATGPARSQQRQAAPRLDEAQRLHQEAVNLYHAGRYDAAIPVAMRALALWEQIRGPKHPDVATALTNLALLYHTTGHYTKAEPLLQRALALQEQALGPAHASIALTLNNLAGLYHTMGAYAKAEPFYARALRMWEQALGPEHPDIVPSLNNLAGLYHTMGAYAKAEPFYARALTIREQTLGVEHPDVALSLNNLGWLYHTTGDYAKAEPLLQRALRVWEQALGPAHPSVALACTNLAALATTLGDYAQAEPLYQRALGIREQALGSEHPDVAMALNNLAELYHTMGDYTKAEPLYQRALALQEQILGPVHPDVAIALNNLAELYRTMGDYTKAEPLYQRALALQEQGLGSEHPRVAFALNNLGLLYHTTGTYTKAEPLYQRALGIRERALGAEHPDVALSLNNLGWLYHTTGAYAKAEPLYQRALGLMEQALGPAHPDVAGVLSNLVLLCAAQGDLAKAIAYQTRAEQIHEQNIALHLVMGSERQKLLYLATLAGTINITLTLHVALAPEDPVARRLALTTVLQRKGRTLDALLESLATLRHSLHPQDHARIGQLTAARARLATLMFAKPRTTESRRHRATIHELGQQLEALEADLSRRSAAFRGQTQPVTIEALQAVLPPEAALVEFVRFDPFDFQHNQRRPPRYVAYVLHHQGEPAWIPLGEAQEIEAAVHTLRAALRDPHSQESPQLARALDAILMEPVRTLLGETRTVLLSPDGALHLLPFAALVDTQERYLVEQYQFIYLTTGRDLLRLQAQPPPGQGSVVIANPAFGTPSVPQGNTGLSSAPARLNRIPTAREVLDVSQSFFSALPGTADEAQALQTLLPQATVLTQAHATERALKHLAAPRLLHIATHGFFLADVDTSPAPVTGRGLTLSSPRPADRVAPDIRVDHPLLRSGLALAGANARRSGEDDGILTALEAAGLHLWGTKLVVLSACDTGVGEVKNGEGVYGLRRALVLAGAETQLMSLWPVSDEGTRDLMIGYYQALQAGQGRGAALRQVQRQMLAHPDRQHPFYWASFIQSGEWADLEGKR
jgi:tetratricopeptide (TPR) repeat protein